MNNRLKKKIVVGVLLLFAGLLLLFLRNQQGAPLVLDRVTVWKEEKWEGNRYVLARVTSGFHDKVESVVLLRGGVRYDKWGNPDRSNTVFEAAIDQKWDRGSNPTRYPVKAAVFFADKRIVVTFDNGETQSFVISM